MIPTVIAWGLVFGRWWKTTLIAAAIAWPALLVATDVMDVEAGLLAASGLALVNAAVGVGVHQAVLRLVRLVRDDTPEVEIG